MHMIFTKIGLSVKQSKFNSKNIENSLHKIAQIRVKNSHPVSYMAVNLFIGLQLLPNQSRELSVDFFIFILIFLGNV